MDAGSGASRLQAAVRVSQGRVGGHGGGGGVVLVVLLGAAAHCCTCAMRNRERPVFSHRVVGAHLCHCGYSSLFHLIFNDPRMQSFTV